MIGSSINCEGRKISNTHVVTKDVFNSRSCPSTGNDNSGRDSVCERSTITGGVCSRGLSQDLHTLHSNQTLIGVKVIVNRNEGTISSSCPFGNTACAEEECSVIPSAGFKFHRELSVVCFTCSNEVFQRINDIFGDDALIVVHEVTVIGCQRIAVELAVNCGSHDGSIIVSFLDGRSSCITEDIQSTGLNKTSQLVLCEAVEIRTGFNIVDHLRSGIRFGDAFDRSIDHDARIFCHEGVDLFLCEFFDTV